MTVDEARRLRDLLTEALRLIGGREVQPQEGLVVSSPLDRLVDRRMAS